MSHGKLLSLGKWWGEKPFVLTRAIILGCVFPASEDPAKWPEDLEIFLRCMCFDSDGMWKRKTKRLPKEICLPEASVDETSALFDENQKWKRSTKASALDAATIFEEEAADKNLLSWFRSKQAGLEKRVFDRLSHAEQRPYCCRVDEVDGPPEASWVAINDYLATRASNLSELVQELSKRKFGTDRLSVGDAFSGTGAIPFAAAELGCDVFASDLNPVAALLTWGALNLIGGTDAFREEVTQAQEQVYQEADEWIVENGYETSEEGWRADIYLHCLEVKVPEWDGWAVPVSPSWVLVPRDSLWVELVPNLEEKRFLFRVREGGDDWKRSAEGTKVGSNLVCPAPLWEHFRVKGLAESMPRKVDWNDLIEAAGGLRLWEKSDFSPRPDDVLQERLYAIRWKQPDHVDDKGRKRKGSFAWREPTDFDLLTEKKISDALSTCFNEWQSAGWIPSWRIEPGKKTDEPIRTRGWTHWHHLYCARELLLQGAYSARVANIDTRVRSALIFKVGLLAECCSKLNVWNSGAGGGAGSTQRMFLQKSYTPLNNYAIRSICTMEKKLTEHAGKTSIEGQRSVQVADARSVRCRSDLWITDPPYADAVNYQELSEVFLSWYRPHLKACFPDWHTDSKRHHAVKGDDAPFRVSMMECYKNLARNMPDDGVQVLMFTHKDTDVWEDLALIMWAAGLQVKQVWSVATETQAGVKKGNYVQATYNMVLKKRQGNEVGFLDFITPQLNTRVREVITNMRDSEVAAGGKQTCGYTDTDYLLAAQAVAAEVITGYATIEGMDLDKELRTPNRDRADSPLKRLMDNAKQLIVAEVAQAGWVRRKAALVPMRFGVALQTKRNSC